MAAYDEQLTDRSPPAIASYRLDMKEIQAEKRRKRNAEVDDLIRNLADPRVAEKLRIYRLVEQQFQEIENQVERQVRAEVQQLRSNKPGGSRKKATEDSSRFGGQDLEEANRLFQRIDNLKYDRDRRQDEDCPWVAKVEARPTSATKLSKSTPSVRKTNRPIAPPPSQRGAPSAARSSRQRPAAVPTAHPSHAPLPTLPPLRRPKTSKLNVRKSLVPERARDNTTSTDAIVLHGPPIKQEPGFQLKSSRAVVTDSKLPARNVALTTYVYDEPTSKMDHHTSSERCLVLTGHLIEAC